MKKLAILMVVILGATLGMYGLDESLYLGKIVFKKGDVQLKRGSNEWQLLEKESGIYVGDKVKTLSKSEATFRYADGTILKLKPATIVEFKVNGLRLYLGKTWFKVIKRRNQFEVQTPSMIAGIRGTVFDVDVKLNGDSKLRVFEGLVAVTGQSKTVMVEKGKETFVAKGSVPSEPTSFDIISARREWIAAVFNPFLKLKKDVSSKEKKSKFEDLENRICEKNKVDKVESNKETSLAPESYLDAYQKFLELKIKYHHDMKNPEVRKAFLYYKDLYEKSLKNKIK